MEELNKLNRRFVWKKDGKLDSWRILDFVNKSRVYGDCDDYACTALYALSGKSLVKFWFSLITFKAVIWHCKTPSGSQHVMLWYKGKGYIDNRGGYFQDKASVKKVGYKLLFPWPWPLVAVKMLLGKYFR